LLEKLGNVIASITYVASKAELTGLTERLAIQLAPLGIKVNVVVSSFIK